MKYYLHIENNTFSFYVKDIHDITDKDIKISTEDYDKFFEEQTSGKQYHLKKELPKSGGLFDYVEEYEPEQIEIQKTEEEQYKEDLENYMLDLDYRVSCQEMNL